VVVLDIIRDGAETSVLEVTLRKRPND
jgi:hypothetical protein